MRITRRAFVLMSFSLTSGTLYGEPLHLPTNHRGASEVPLDGEWHVQVLIPLLIARWTAVAPNMTVHRLDGPVQFNDLYGNVREAEAALGCGSSGPHLDLSPTVSLETLVHELAHAHDCLDNDEMDASPTQRPAVRRA
jgi:hypothetical protein